MEQGDYAPNHVFYIDGFPDFTRQHLEILEYLIQNAPCVTVSLNCDSVKSTALAFEKAGETAAQLVRIAQKHNVRFEMEQIQAAMGNLAAVRSALYQGEIPFVPSGVSLYRAQSVYGGRQSVSCHLFMMVQGIGILALCVQTRWDTEIPWR